MDSLKDILVDVRIKLMQLSLRCPSKEVGGVEDEIEVIASRVADALEIVEAELNRIREGRIH